MTATAYRSRFGEWENAPVVQDAVLAYMDSVGGPVLLREVYRPLGLPAGIVNRVLRRLHTKGILTRWKIPVETHRPGAYGQPAASGGVMRQCYLYAFSDGGEAAS